MIGKKVSHYEVTHHLGSGGMGEVYKATDLTLGRSVAIKFLPQAFLDDAERSSRFQREARLLAALSHPNIAVLYGTEQADGQSFLVMELVPGETLAERIARGPVPTEEALPIAAQIAEGLEAAHEKGIVHRDLKPANIKILPNGLVKVLDFGLAKVRDGATESPDMPTMMTASIPGIILGTPAYMSPEQAKGLETDRATDIWSFGCVLYELLTGRTAFAGKTSTEVLAEVLKSEPDWSSLPAQTPEQIRRLLRRCLQKDVRSRFHDIGDVRIEIEDTETAVAVPAARQKVSGRRERIAWALVAIAIAAFFLLRPAAVAPEIQAEIVTTPPADDSSLAISPDGSEVAFTALTTDGTALWLRSMSSKVARPLAGTQGAALPFWSPKKHSLAFFAQSKLKRIDIDTGEVQTLADASPTPTGGTWNKDGVILFSPRLRGGVLRVDETGGSVATLIDEGVAPKFFPDGQRFLFRRQAPLVGEIFVSTLDGLAPYSLIKANAAIPVSDTHILYTQQRGMVVQGFDPNRRLLTGKPTPVTESVSVSADGMMAAVSVSQNGSLVFRPSAADGGTRRFAWFDRMGKELSKVGEIGGFSPDITPDGRFMALSRATTGNPSVWQLETATGRVSVLTSDTSQVSLFSPDGTEIVYSKAGVSSIVLIKKPVNGGNETEKPLLVLPESLVATDWSHSHLLFRSNNIKTGFDIQALPMRGNEPAGSPFPVVQTEYSERDAQFSPDGKWIAYESDSSGISEIYVHPFPGPGRAQPVSKGGGVQARWNPRGKELFYISLDGRLISVAIRFAADGSIEASDPVALFRTRMGTVFFGVHTQQYLVSDDGQRFLISTIADNAVSPINVILNWRIPSD